MRVLVVEDDRYKRTEITSVLRGLAREIYIAEAESVNTACLHVYDERFDLVILDMSLPTFEQDAPGGGGSPQGQGGLEVLRVLKRLGSRSQVIVVSQYPEIELERQIFELGNAPSVLSDYFRVSVIGAVLYEFRNEAWKSFLSALVGHCATDV